MGLWSGRPVCDQVAYLLGAERVIAIDEVPGRLRMAAEDGKAETLNFNAQDIYEKLTEMTGGIRVQHLQEG